MHDGGRDVSSGISVDVPAPVPARPRIAAFEAGVLAAAATVALVMGTAFEDHLTTSRLLLVLVSLLLAEILFGPQLFIFREFILYLLFVAYQFLTLLWAPDPVLAMNTLFPAVDFLFILVIVGSLVRFSDARAVLRWTLLGLWAGAGIFTYVVGFPFALPHEMSYNAIATIYLYGLYVALTLACMTRSRAFLLALALLAAVHIVATTSIKTNLGVLLGAIAAMIVYFRESLRLVSRHIFLLAIAVGAIAYGIASSDLAVEGLQRGVNRVALGVNVLEARSDQSGYSGFEERAYWAHEGLQGWTRNPLFGHGVEAFRAKFGITSHSTPVDLLYNTGLIGFTLFYAMFISLLWRLFETQAAQSFKALTLASVVCSVFMGLSGTFFYQYFLAGSIAISVAMLQRSDQHARDHDLPLSKGAG
jgi:hypothetical protein